MSNRSLKDRVGKSQPFDSSAQEAHLNLMRTASELAGPLHALFKPHKLTDASYNTLRILRGHQAQGENRGIRASRIGCEMVVRVPDVTRIVDRLVDMELASRNACDLDRRVVYVSITQKGLDLLSELDDPVKQMHQRTLGHMTDTELLQLNNLLEKARAAVEESEQNK